MLTETVNRGVWSGVSFPDVSGRLPGRVAMDTGTPEGEITTCNCSPWM